MALLGISHLGCLNVSSGKVLISATLTPQAYELYSEWAKSRTASEMISKAICEQFSHIGEVEAIRDWKYGRLVVLMRTLIEKIPKEEWYKIDAWDRECIYNLARPTKSHSAPNMSWDDFNQDLFAEEEQ